MSEKIPMEQIYESSIREAIGTLFLTSAVAETVLTICLLRLLGHLHSQNPHIMLPLQGMAIRVKLQTINAAAAMIISEEKDNIKNLCRKIDKAFEKRNLFAHGMTSRKTTGNKIAIFYPKFTETGDFPQPEVLTSEQIRQYARKIYERTLALDDYLTDAGIQQLLDDK